MTRTRRDVYQLPDGDTTLDWYGRAVTEMRSRPATDPTSWQYQSAIHGINRGSPFWTGIGQVPSPAEQATYWNQCQHGSWYFLPWHRMYLAFFEAIVARTIADLGGPADWSLPFWNYSDAANPRARQLPPAFSQGTSATNPLQMPDASDGSAGRDSDTVEAQDVTLDALDLPDFAGIWRGAEQGFGGPVTPFSHSGGAHGALEHLPHDFVHVDIGGAMGDPATAALDPIFWLHHANIDRLWQVWLNRNPQHINPSSLNWLNYPFNFHDGQGTATALTPAQVLDTRTLLTGYVYEGVPPLGATTSAVTPALGINISQFKTTLSSAFTQLAKSATEVAPEVLAASNSPLTLAGQPAEAQLAFLPPARRRSAVANAAVPAVTAFAAAAEAPVTTEETYLNFENITGTGIPPVHDVFVGAAGQTGHYAGSLPFFGVAESSIADVQHSGSGQSYVLDITALTQQLRNAPDWDPEGLHVRIVPRRAPRPGSGVTIGRISLYVR